MQWTGLSHVNDDPLISKIFDFPVIFLSSRHLAQDEEELQKLQITHVLSVGFPCCNWACENLTCLYIEDLPDDGSTLLEPILKLTRKFLMRALKDCNKGSNEVASLQNSTAQPNSKCETYKNISILIHCYEGRSRSVSILIDFIQFYNRNPKYMRETKYMEQILVHVQKF